MPSGPGAVSGFTEFTDNSVSSRVNGIMMHAKYMHKLYSLLCIFLQIIMLLVVIIMICNHLWGYSIDPPYFGYNCAEQKNLVLCIFMF
jgi:hypothetical protein